MPILFSHDILMPACEVYHVVSSPASGLLRELLQLHACLPLMEAAYLALSHPSAYVVLGAMPCI